MIETMSFAENLKRLMKERGITSRTVSQATGIPTSTLSEWTAGREPKLGPPVVKLARFFGVSLECLVTGEEETGDVVAAVLDNLNDEFATIHEGVYRLKIEKMKSK